jgi:ATP-dependent exoDNAse (exonuclease V) beta subunit
MIDNRQLTGGVTFFEGPHTYENSLGQKYISVTQLLGKFKEKFNPREAAEKASNGSNTKYMGRSVESIMAEWEKAGEDARTRGTSFHKGKEDDHNKQAYEDSKRTSGFTPNAKMIIPQENQGVETDYKWLPDGEYSELILWSHKYHLAGIADKVIVDGDFFDIEDYKTNKSIDRTSFYDRSGRGYKKLLWPLDHIMDCSFEVYQLQLSIYAYMFAELSGKTPRRLTILHHPTIDGKPREQETRYECEYKKYDLMLMFNMWGGYAPPDYKPTNQQKLPEGL